MNGFHFFSARVTSTLQDRIAVRLSLRGIEAYEVSGTFSQVNGLILVSLENGVTDAGRPVPVTPGEVLYFKPDTTNELNGFASYDFEPFRLRHTVPTSHSNRQPTATLAGA